MNEGRAGCTDNLDRFNDASLYCAQEGEGVFEMVLRLQNEKREKEAKAKETQKPQEGEDEPKTLA